MFFSLRTVECRLRGEQAGVAAGHLFTVWLNRSSRVPRLICSLRLRSRYACITHTHITKDTGKGRLANRSGRVPAL